MDHVARGRVDEDVLAVAVAQAHNVPHLGAAGRVCNTLARGHPPITLGSSNHLGSH